MTQLKIASLTGLLMVGAIAAYASNEPSQSLPENALTQDQATEIVLAEHPGSVVEFEREHEDGMHVFEVCDRIHIHRLGRRLTVINPRDHEMSDAVAYMTGAKEPEPA